MSMVMDCNLSVSPTDHTASAAHLIATSPSSNAEVTEPISKNAKATRKHNLSRYGTDKKQRRVRKACERCRVKKTKVRI